MKFAFHMKSTIILYVVLWICPCILLKHQAYGCNKDRSIACL